ncbi:hypothetical protein ACFYZB_45155, partial [Streptomyces sp. NPDC001852]|uniref:hypothetical protein n=1 Tax=Streptomyces sp. NPDC001852 TaxID=3364619 RepID=UPI0036A3C159
MLLGLAQRRTRWAAAVADDGLSQVRFSGVRSQRRRIRSAALQQLRYRGLLVGLGGGGPLRRGECGILVLDRPDDTELRRLLLARL